MARTHSLDRSKRENWNFSCPDWETRLRKGQSLLPDLPLDLREAARAQKIFDNLRLPDVPGQPYLGEAAGDWMRDVVAAIHGSLVDGTRMVSEIFLMLPKKNAKTTGGAAFTLTSMLMNARPRAEFIYIAPTHEISEVAFSQTEGMIQADEDQWLQRKFHIASHLKTINDLDLKARLKVKTFDMKVITGSKPVFVLLDELHLMSTMSQATRILRQIRGGLLTNPESCLIMITTQSDEPPAGVFKSELQFARGVRDGRIKKSRMLPMLYEFPEAMQRDASWLEVENWPMVLPNLNKSIGLDALISDFDSEKEKGEAELRLWASQHLNVEVGVALHSDRWPGVDHWEKQGTSAVTLESIIGRCDVAVVGIDGGGLDDLLGVCVCGRDRDTQDWLMFFRAWCFETVFDERPEIAERLRDFENDGDLTVCKTATDDVIGVADICEQLLAAGILPKEGAIGIDTVGVTAIMDELNKRDISDKQAWNVPQGYKLSGTIKGFARRLMDGRIWHDGSDMMKWCVGNAKQEQRGNAVLITKQQSGTCKIDPLVAGFNAVFLMSYHPEGKGKSVYQARGAHVL